MKSFRIDSKVVFQGKVWKVYANLLNGEKPRCAIGRKSPIPEDAHYRGGFIYVDADMLREATLLDSLILGDEHAPFPR